jgi:hypothetical protein
VPVDLCDLMRHEHVDDEKRTFGQWVRDDLKRPDGGARRRGSGSSQRIRAPSSWEEGA